MRGVFLDLKTFREQVCLEKIEQQLDELTCFDITKAEQVVERCQNMEVIITNKVVITADIMRQLPKLKLICIAATGTNNVDLSAAKTLKIGVCNVSGYSTPSVSQYVFAQLLEYFNRTSHHNSNTAKGIWQQSPVFCHLGQGFSELNGKTLGIVGYGNLGKAVAKIANAFGMQVLIAERPNASQIRAGREAFETVLQRADIVTLHCPQTPETENLINQTSLSLMKPNSVLINTSRGPVVNSKDLHYALVHRVIGYAILDVLEQEPPPKDHILLTGTLGDGEPLSNLKLTAHIAWASDQAQDRLISLIGENIQAYKRGQVLNRVEL